MRQMSLTCLFAARFRTPASQKLWLGWHRVIESWHAAFSRPVRTRRGHRGRSGVGPVVFPRSAPSHQLSALKPPARLSGPTFGRCGRVRYSVLDPPSPAAIVLVVRSTEKYLQHEDYDYAC